MSWLTASCLTAWLPHKTWSGTSDLNRDSLGPRPSGLIRFPSPRMSKIWSERLESNQRPRASETRALIQLSYANKRWNRRPESNRHFFVRTEASSPLDDARTIGVTGGNRTLVDRSTVCRLSHSATVTLGARGTSRTCLSSFSDWRLDRNGLPGELGGRGGNRTLICWLQASGPPVERLPQLGCGLAS